MGEREMLGWIEGRVAGVIKYVVEWCRTATLRRRAPEQPRAADPRCRRTGSVGLVGVEAHPRAPSILAAAAQTAAPAGGPGPLAARSARRRGGWRRGRGRGAIRN